MSWDALAYAKKLTHAPTGQPITRSEKLLLLVMAEYYNAEEDLAWASVPELARHSLLSERQTQRLLHSLVTKEVVTAVPRFRANGGYSSTGYRIPALTTQTPGDTMSPPLVTPCHHPGDTRCHHPGDMVSPAFLNLLSESLPESEIPPISPRKGKRTKTSKTPATNYTPGFALVWHAYPAVRHEGKVATFALWQERGLEERAPEIAEKLTRLTHTLWAGREKTYIPLPHTWFHQARYEDELVPLDEAVPVSAVSNAELARRLTRR